MDGEGFGRKVEGGSPSGGSQRGGWTKERRTRFLDCLAATGNVTRALAAAGDGGSTSSLYQLRRRDAGFAAAWDAALQQAYQLLEAELLARALGSGADGGRPDGSQHAAGETFNAELALKLLAQRNGQRTGDARRTGQRIDRNVSIDEVDAVLAKRLAAVEKRLKDRS